ncbi:MAG: FimV family protein [Gammaproteobacteria bacterium]|nr:FimV family protein [Gammaproteobacteria bacterium]
MKWRVVMLRKLAVFIVSAGLTMSPLSVQALGFGGIKLKSSLSEKLNAEVSLLSATANDVQSLTIKLATEEAFLRSGINRTALLNKLKFKVKQNSDGEYYIHVTTSEGVREPFMNFLLEMNWKNGRMLREYTMLIDPPGRAPKQIAEPAPVIAETISAEPEVEFEEPVIEAEEPTPFVEPVAEIETTAEVEAGSSVIIEEEPEAAVIEEEAVAEEPVVAIEEESVIEEELVAEAIEVEPVAEVAEPDLVEETSGVEEAFESDDIWPRIPLAAYGTEEETITEEPVEITEEEGELGDLDYGITKANDNLWNIAEKLRQGDDSVSVYQVMMALLKSNPDAFIDNNVHRLKVGHVLRIDDPTVLTSISRKEAANSFIEQTGSWNSYRQQVAEAAGVQPIIAGGNVAESETAPTETTGELTLSSPDGKSLTAGGGSNEETLSNDLATMQEQLRQAKSDSGTMRTRNVELNNKLQSLEDELNRLQRSLSVKDDELAALQQQLSSLNQQPAVEAPPVVTEESAKPEVAEPVVAEERVKPEVVEPAVVAEEPVKPEVVEAPVAEVKPEEPAAPAAEQGIMDTVMGIIASVGGIVAGLNLGSDSLLFIAAPILLVLLIIVAIVIKRRRQGDNFQESILTGTASAADGAGTVSGDSTTFSEESSFLSDFAMSGASAIEADDSEVDPLTEADVFMAYGRYEAAEERLNEAIQHEPDRMELRAKLLELHHATQNKDAFEAAAEDFYASLGGADNPLWDKVVSMGSEIAPANPLFNQGGGAADIPAASEVPAIDDPGMAMTDSQVMDIGLETGVFAAADLGVSSDASADDMDFNLDLGDMGESTAGAEPDMDFNLDMGSTESADDAVTEDAGLDFNLDIGGDAPAEEPAADLDFNLDMGTEESADAGGLDFDLNIGGEETEAADVSLDFDAGTDEGSLDLNLDASDTADADLGGGDEVGTKLDLAKAYIDMGDPEGARSILDEVMDEGSSTQKEEAQSLLGQIA